MGRKHPQQYAWLQSDGSHLVLLLSSFRLHDRRCRESRCRRNASRKIYCSLLPSNHRFPRRGRHRHTCRCKQVRHRQCLESGVTSMNPFSVPDRIFISKHPQDIRAGIRRLSEIIAAGFGMEPTDGSLYVFISRTLGTACRHLRQKRRGGSLRHRLGVEDGKQRTQEPACFRQVESEHFEVFTLNTSMSSRPPLRSRV